MHFLEKLKELEKSSVLPPENKSLIISTLQGFFHSYAESIKANGGSIEYQMPLLNKFLEMILEQVREPFQFDSYHHRILIPFDYYQFGLEFLRPLVKLDQSTILGLEHLNELDQQIRKGDNVILLSNHQTEPDPQAISLLLEKSHSNLAQHMIFVAGHRVTTDPMAVPFSLGRNLLCIYSKNYINHPPEKKDGKIRHNQKSMKKMRELLSEGGKCIYVAPSGGRDRRNEEGCIEVAPFDPQSIEMLLFTANHALVPTHFYPLALSTFDLLPPPSGIKIELGEARKTKSTPIHLAFGGKINMEDFPGMDLKDKKERRSKRAEHLWGIVQDLFNHIKP